MRKKKPRKNYWRLITSPREIRKRTGFHTKNPKPLCNMCSKRVHKVTIDRGKKIAEATGTPRFDLIGWWCDECLHFHNIMKVIGICNHEHDQLHKVTIDRGKKIAEEAGIPRFDQIGWWCYECCCFHQTKRRRVTIEKRSWVG